MACLKPTQGLDIITPGKLKKPRNAYWVFIANTILIPKYRLTAYLCANYKYILSIPDSKAGHSTIEANLLIIAFSAFIPKYIDTLNPYIKKLALDRLPTNGTFSPH